MEELRFPGSVPHILAASDWVRLSANGVGPWSALQVQRTRLLLCETASGP